jgi:hypothetical protein
LSVHHWPKLAPHTPTPYWQTRQLQPSRQVTSQTAYSASSFAAHVQCPA